MKKIFIILSFVVSFNTIYSQHHLYLGARAGTGYGNEMYKLTGLIFGYDYSPSLQVMQTHEMKTKTNAICASAKAEILYGYKKFRIGYQFDYLFFKGINYYSKLTPPETGSSQDVFKGKTNVVKNFVGNSLLVEVTAFQKKYFSISPNLSIGYFNSFDKEAAAKMNYFQAGIGLMFGLEIKQITLYINPDYSARYSKYKYVGSTTFQNPYRLNQSVLINFGIRGDLLSLKKDKGKK